MFEVRLARAEELAACLWVRRRVFIEEQEVPEGLEVDGLDGDCTHFIALEDDRTVGTARLRALPEHHEAKAERVAVLAERRGLGLGGRLMDVLEAEARRRGFRAVVLHAQVSALEFYRSRAYVELGPRFWEASIEHQEMRLELGP